MGNVAIITTGGAACDWTKRYRLAAGVYAMCGAWFLMLERAQGMRIGFWSVPGGSVDRGETPREAARSWARKRASRPQAPCGSSLWCP
ncbi:MAG TPA: NUDIX domain-containing protein [Candidatus Tectomicrobia bacterium]|jgi:ADP-ribose pyrophosphatase YjhB (NUDIX family)